MNARTSVMHLDVDPDVQPARSIIATTQPDLFTPSLSPQIGRTVALFSTGASAIEALHSGGCQTFYADFRQLEDRWTGQRFLRFIRERAEFNHVDFWMMADHWHPSQEQWAIKCGAKGMLKRSPRVLAARILGEAPQLSIALELQLDAIDEIFARFAGSMRSVHTAAAHHAIETGQIEPTREAYVQELAGKLSLSERRDAFAKALWTNVDLNLDVETTQPGDPWMTEVNKVFKRYAGALGARIIISKALGEMEQRGHHDRTFYVSGLSDGLTNPQRRADFISAARDARLIS